MMPLTKSVYLANILTKSVYFADGKANKNIAGFHPFKTILLFLNV